MSDSNEVHSSQDSHQSIEELEFIGPAVYSHLNHKESILFADILQSITQDLRTKGKNPERNRGYAESNIHPILRRIVQVFEYVWENDGTKLEISTEEANDFIKGLAIDEITKKDGEPYAEGSKRKFVDSLAAYFRVKEVDWTPEIKFGEGQPKLDSDPFTKEELRELQQAALEYKTPPAYSNVSPEERDRWNTHLAQHLGKSKSEVGPDDWDALRRSWKIPSIISFAIDSGGRAALFNRLLIQHLHPESDQVELPGDVTVKNNSDWTINYTHKTGRILEKWLDERDRKPKYDQSDHLWLNRKGNPYHSKTLNDLLSSLVEFAGIDPGGRKLTWHSIRHSTGMYTYEDCEDLALVARILRLESLEAARIYAHPTPEAERNVLESINGGGSI